MKYASLLLILIFSTLIFSKLPIYAKGKKAPSIGSLDINSQETGDGAGCFFALSDSGVETYVFVERDGYGWMRINEKINQFLPDNQFVMWPSKKGKKLNRVYTLNQSIVHLDIEVMTGCGEQEDNCTVIYEGTLNLTIEANESITKVKGHCGC